MLPRKNRLVKEREFKTVFKEGQTSVGRFFITRFKKNNLNILRFAFVFPVKKEKRATRRNKMKRIFREIVRNNMPNLKQGYDIIFIIKKKSQESSCSEVEKDIKIFFKNKLI